MPGLILAGVNPDNTPSGYDWTFLFPMLLFIVIAAVLYMLFSRPHRRVPGRPITSAVVGGASSPQIAQTVAAAGSEGDGSADDAAQTGQAEHAEGSE